MVDSLEDLKDNNFNYYDAFHIDSVKAVIDMDKLQEAVNKTIGELKAQREESTDRWKGIPKEVRDECEVIIDLEELKGRIEGVNKWIKVKVR